MRDVAVPVWQSLQTRATMAAWDWLTGMNYRIIYYLFILCNNYLPQRVHLPREFCKRKKNKCQKPKSTSTQWFMGLSDKATSRDVE